MEKVKTARCGGIFFAKKKKTGWGKLKQKGKSNKKNKVKTIVYL